MNWIDVLLILVIILAAWSGYRRGFILGSLELISWLGSLAAAFWLYQYLSKLLQMIIPALGVWTMPLSFLMTLIVVRIIFSAIVTAILRRTHREAHYTVANKALGIIPGAVNGMIYAIIISA